MSIEMPVIRIEPPADLRAFAELVKDAHTYQWIVFTSPNGVDVFFDWFYKLYQDARSIGGARIAAIGPGTAERVKAYHLAVDLMPEKSSPRDWSRPSASRPGPSKTKPSCGSGPRARATSSPTSWQKLGAIVDEAIAYRTVAETGGCQRRDPALPRGRRRRDHVHQFIHRRAFP